MTAISSDPAATRAAGLLEAAARRLADDLTEITNQLRDPNDRAAGALRQRDVAARAAELLGMDAAVNMRAAHRRGGMSQQQVTDALNARGVDISKSGVAYWIRQADAAKAG